VVEFAALARDGPFDELLKADHHGALIGGNTAAHLRRQPHEVRRCTYVAVVTQLATHRALLA
jgi:hypothetical protein